jgi:hypothetical protein
MAEQDRARKEPLECEPLSTDEARDGLGPLILRAGFGNERIPLTYHGELRAAIVGLRDLEYLRKRDEEAA